MLDQQTGAAQRRGRERKLDRASRVEAATTRPRDGARRPSADRARSTPQRERRRTPNSTAVTIDAPDANASARRSIVASVSRGTANGKQPHQPDEAGRAAARPLPRPPAPDRALHANCPAAARGRRQRCPNRDFASGAQTHVRAIDHDVHRRDQQHRNDRRQQRAQRGLPPDRPDDPAAPRRAASVSSGEGKDPPRDSERTIASSTPAFSNRCPRPQSADDVEQKAVDRGTRTHHRPVAVDRRRPEPRLQRLRKLERETRPAGRRRSATGVLEPRRCCRRCAGRPETGARSSACDRTRTSRSPGRGRRPSAGRAAGCPRNRRSPASLACSAESGVTTACSELCTPPACRRTRSPAPASSENRCRRPPPFPAQAAPSVDTDTTVPGTDTRAAAAARR